MGKTATQEVEVRVVVPPSGSVLVKVWATGADVVLDPDVIVDCGVALASVEDGPGVTDSSIWRVLANLPGLPLNEYLTWGKKKVESSVCPGHKSRSICNPDCRWLFSHPVHDP